MRFLTTRAFVTPALLAVGLLAMLGGDVDSGAIIAMVGIGFWVIVGWGRRWRGNNNASSSRRAPDVVTVVDQGARSDGVGGAFARLHPEMRTWLEGELRARRDGTETR